MSGRLVVRPRTAALAALLFVSLPQVASADDWGPAGCGLGNRWFGKEHQLMAYTANNIGLNQMFGISSGTSGCGETTQSAQGVEAFIQANRQALAKDISRGTGETIAGLSSLAGCRDTALLGRALQAEYEHIFPRASSNAQVSRAVVETLQAHPELACSLAI